jgi:L-amino acid N-acyltransferase
MLIREAVQADFDEITAIYNEIVANSTAIYNDRPATCEERIAWWRSRQEQGYPVLVATDASRWLHLAALETSDPGPDTVSPSKGKSIFKLRGGVRALERNY